MELGVNREESLNHEGHEEHEVTTIVFFVNFVTFVVQNVFVRFVVKTSYLSEIWMFWRTFLNVLSYVPASVRGATPIT